MTAAYSLFAKAGPRIVPEPIPALRIPRPIRLLALVAALVLVALPLASAARDHRTDNHLAAIDATDRAGDFGPITED
jgi:hypothetical protein